MNSCIHEFMHSYIHSFIHSLIHHSFIHSFIIHSFVLSFIHSFIHSFVHSFVHSFIRSYSLCVDRLSILESLLNQQRQAASSYRTREIQGALKSCQGLIAEVKKQSECSIPECVEETNRQDELCRCPGILDTKNKPDNRSLLMTYAQTANNPGPRNMRDSTSKNQACAHKQANGRKHSTGASGSFRTAMMKGDKEKLNILQNPVSPLNRSSASEA